jgi:ABC-2 type transport system permease protein
MLVISTVFGALLKVQVPHFATYYIVGWSMWNFFSEATSLSMASVLGGAALIKKVYIPKYIFPLEKCLFALVNFVLSLIAVVLVMCLQGVFDGFTHFTFLFAPLPILYCLMFSIGFSLVLSALTVYFRDVMHLYSVVLTAWMYITPIIYPISILEGHPFVETVVRCNPMYYMVDYFRQIMMYGQVPSLTHNLICLGIGVVSLALGWLIFSKAQKKFILHI